MSGANGKSTLIVIRHSPYGSGLARASLDVALAAAAFDQAINLLFMGDGVLQLIPEQDSATIGMKNIGRTLASLALHDIDSVYVDAAAAARYQIDLEAGSVITRPVNGSEMHDLMCKHDHLLGF